MARKTRSGEDLFLAGRRLGWIPIGFSLFASNISSTTLVGLSGAAYTWGIAVSNYEWMAAFVLVFFAIFFIPYYLNARILHANRAGSIHSRCWAFGHKFP